MSFAPPRARSEVRGALIGSLRLGLRLSLVYVAAQALLLATLESAGALRGGSSE